MFYEQHKFVGDSIHVGRDVFLPKKYAAQGPIVFSQKEHIKFAQSAFLRELQSYNKSIAKLSRIQFREKVEHDALKLEVRRTFGDVNAWSGDHAKLNPPNGRTTKFVGLNIELQEIDKHLDIGDLSLALHNWDHFMPLCYSIWASFHKQALRLASAFSKTRKKGFTQGGVFGQRGTVVLFHLEDNELARALFLEAYGCHFLQDCYAAGHLRTPRLLFGTDPRVALLSLKMHDEDNDRRLWAYTRDNQSFRLIGEHKKKDDFRKLDDSKKDPAMQRVLDEVRKTMSISVQQVLDAAFPSKEQTRTSFVAVKNRLPQVQVSWLKLGKKRSRTHALEIWPVAKVKTPNPAFKIHANYNINKGTFEDPMLFRRTSDNSWGKVPFVGNDLKVFTPGKKLAWWIPMDPEEKRILP